MINPKHIMVFVDDVRLKIFHLLSEATLQGISSMGALRKGGGRRMARGEGWTALNY